MAVRTPESRGYRDVRNSNAPMVDYPVPTGPQPPTQYYGGNTYGQLGPLGVDPRHIGSVSAHNDPYHSTMSAVSVNGAVGPVVSYYSRDPHVLWAPSVPDPMMLLDKFMSAGYGPDPRFVAAMGNVARDLGKPIRGSGSASAAAPRGSSAPAAPSKPAAPNKPAAPAAPKGEITVSFPNKDKPAETPKGTVPEVSGKLTPPLPKDMTADFPVTVFTDSANDGGAKEAYTINKDGTVTISPDVQDRVDAIRNPANMLQRGFEWLGNLIAGYTPETPYEPKSAPTTLSEASAPAAPQQPTALTRYIQENAPKEAPDLNAVLQNDPFHRTSATDRMNDSLREYLGIKPWTPATAATQGATTTSQPSVLRTPAAPLNDPMNTPPYRAVVSTDITEDPAYDRAMGSLQAMADYIGDVSAPALAMGRNLYNRLMPSQQVAMTPADVSLRDAVNGQIIYRGGVPVRVIVPPPNRGGTPAMAVTQRMSQKNSPSALNRRGNKGKNSK